MGIKRPFKVRYHFDGTKTFSDQEAMPDSYVIDTSRPIDGVSSHTELDSAETAARRVSRNGGSAQITLRDNATGVETQIKGYTPYEVAVEDLIQSAGEAA